MHYVKVKSENIKILEVINQSRHEQTNYINYKQDHFNNFH